MSNCIIAQKSNSQTLFATDSSQVVTNPLAGADAQVWTLNLVSPNVYTIERDGLFLDAFPDQGNDYNVVMRPAQADGTQHWTMTKVAENEFSIQQVSSNLYLDAYQNVGNDFRVVKRDEQLGDDTQVWIVTPA